MKHKDTTPDGMDPEDSTDMMGENMGDHSHWIQSAIRHHGALRAQAQKAGAIDSNGNISQEWLNRAASKGGLLGKRASLALTLKGMDSHKG